MDPTDEEILLHFTRDLASWTLADNISQSSLQRLIPLLRKVPSLSHLPKRAVTILKTPKDKPILKKVEPGYYWHHGIENSLRDVAEAIEADEKIKSTSLIELTVSLDGVPLTRSSASNLEPITASIDCTREILLIGAYHGSGKPGNYNRFLEDFVTETIHLMANGFIIIEKKYYIKIVKIIMDMPAKSAALYIKGHAGYFSCTKCIIKGKWKSNRVYFHTTNDKLRSDEDFLSRTQADHHLGISILTHIPLFKPISHISP